MEIADDVTGLKIKPNETYVKCFKSNIRNIKISSGYYPLANPLRLFRLIRLKCCENLKELDFNSVNLNSAGNYGEMIQQQLENVATISFVNCKIHDIYNCFLKYCTQLRHLVFKEEIPFQMDCTWMIHNYPYLESFVYHVVNNVYRPPLKVFFQLNPQIQCIACSDIAIVTYLTFIPNIHLNYLVLFIRSESDFANIFLTLEKMCETRWFDRLKLDFDISVSFSTRITEKLNVLGEFKEFEGLSLVTKELQLIEHHPIVHQTFEHVKYLKLEVLKPMGAWIFHIIPSTVPNVKEIDFHPWFGNFIGNFNDSIGIIATSLRKLETIIIRRIDCKVFSKCFSVVEMDVKRRQLSDACVLTIFLPHEILQKTSFISLSCSSINIKPISELKHDIYTFETSTILNL